MIFDIKDAILILGGLILTTIFFVDYVVNSGSTDEECPHCFADFQSIGIRKCIDCGLEQPIKKPSYPKHQR